MKKIIINLLVNYLILSLAVCIPLSSALAVCSSGTVEPPFLSFGVKSNLLLLLDNSGSMLDLAYVDNDEQCYDETFDNTLTYAGYFDEATWYQYDFTADDAGNDAGERFEAQASEPAVCNSGEYTATDADSNKYVCVDVVDPTSDPKEVDAFVATGNFMNWLASSKFDVQKEILSGGKYESYNYNLQMESRGCQGRRFVKQLTLDQDDSGVKYKLALGVRGPMEVYNTWLPSMPSAKVNYAVGDIVTYNNVLYMANTAHEASDEFSSDAANWDEYKETRWYPGQTYPANTAVFDVATGGWYWTQEGGTSATSAADITEDISGSGGTVTWVQYDGTSIEIFDIVAGGYNATACQEVIDMLDDLDGTDADGSSDDDDTKLGQLKKKTEECMGFDEKDALNRARKSSFNHAMQECWYYDKFDHWQAGNGTVNSLKSSCGNVYDFMYPHSITPFDSAYVCSGSYQPEDDKSQYGYIGRCWEMAGATSGCADATCGATGTDFPDRSEGEYWQGEGGVGEFYCSGGLVRECTKNNCSDDYSKPEDWRNYQTCDSGGGGNLDNEWTDDDFYYFNPCTYNSCGENDSLVEDCPKPYSGTPEDYTCTNDGTDWACFDQVGDSDYLPEYCGTPDNDNNGDLCVDQALKDFCGIYSVSEVIDPSDAVTSTGEVWNIPAFLIDSGVISQLDLPIATMRGYVQQDTAPEGILQSVTSDLRIGVMAFNDNGALTECSSVDVNDAIEKYCPDDNKDGARVMANIQLGSTETGTGRTHADDVATAINNTRANSWTPLAEAVYNAIGYYTQSSGRRLDNNDFAVSANAYANGTDYLPGAIVTSGGVYYQTILGGTSSGATPLTDTGVVWSPIDGLDPVTDWCQENHLLIISEGSSTADINSVVTAFAANNSDGDSDTGTCSPDDLQGSTYLDDLTYFAQHADAVDLYPTGKSQLLTVDGEYKDKPNITTHIVVAGDLRGEVTDNDECSPARIMYDAAKEGGSDLIVSASPQELEEDLLEVFNEIRKRASAGSAASVISSSRGGEGAIYQAIFWPEREFDDNGSSYKITWLGDVHALFIDENGYMYEDTNSDRVMTPWNDSDEDNICDNGEGDCRVIIYFDEAKGRSLGCYNTSIFDNDVCTVSKEMEDIKFLWSANDWLSGITDADITSNRSYDSANQQRYIFTWNDISNDGVVQTDEVLEFVPNQYDWTGAQVNGATLASNRGSVANDFNAADNDEVDEIVSWIRGLDGAGLRSRRYVRNSSDIFTWRLGDVIHSTPMVVASPAEGFNYLYHDLSYAEFSAKYKDRRQMIYFGGNDGMLHAVNGGFYDEADKKFWLGFNPDNDEYNDSGPKLGAELWAYVPYNLLPHLKCLTDPDYLHKYYVDLRPRIFDAQIFPAGSKHPYGWGTILVGGMRFGGFPVRAEDLNGQGDDNRVLTSAYFILDITDPEDPPVLMGEMTRTTEDENLNGILDAGEDDNGNNILDNDGLDMGYSTSIPTMVIMKDILDDDHLYSNITSDWHLILGSGPHGADALKGVSDQKAKVAVLPMNDTYLVNNARIPDSDPDDAANGDGGRGRYVLPDNDSFVSDLITVDFDINPSTVDYMADVVYFGTVSGNFNGGVWNDGGSKLYRLITRDNDNTGSPSGTYTTPDYYYGTDIVQKVTKPEKWKTKSLIDVGLPITGAPNVGYDGANFWVYFGTGRFYDPDDKTDDTQQRFYGIKEPMDWVSSTTRNFKWDTVEENPLVPSLVIPGEKGLLDVSEIIVEEPTTTSRNLWCLDNDDFTNLDADNNVLPTKSGSDNCLPAQGSSTVTTFSDLRDYIADVDQYDINTHLIDRRCDSSDGYTNCKDGWYKNFWPYRNRERNLGQSTLLGGLLLFTTYQPYSDVCRAEGEAYLYGVYYQTGTAWTQSVFGTYLSGGTFVMDKLSLGNGLATTPNLHVGAGDEGGDGPKAFIQTSTGEIKEIKQEVSPLNNFKTGRSKWKEYQR